MSFKNSLSKMAVAAVVSFGAATAFAQVTVNKADGWFETAYAEWAPVSGASSYNVYADGVKVDDPLIRSYGSYVRVDVPGLKAGSHTLKIAPVVGGSEGTAVTKTVEVKAHDRSGFAFSNGRVPGAYKADGTLKSGAVVLYVTENNKNTITMDVVTNAKGATTKCLSFQGILNCMKKGYETRPVDFRFIGNVTDSDSLVQGDMLIDLGSSENSYVTVEGIGEDATVNGWGIRIKNAQNVEVRNVGIMNVNSGEGDNIGLQQNDQYVWVHNNDFFYGDAGSDKDQVKGDGALDCKKSTYITFSYNHFFDNGKSNLLGLSEGTTEGLYITYHHNWYDHSDSRHPRVRFYSAHVYNNYYDGNAKYGIGSTLGSSIFAEANYFRNCKYPMLTSMQGSDVYAGGTKRDPANYGTFSGEAGGSIKAFNNYIEGGTFIAYGESKYILKGSETAIGAIDSKKDFDAYVITSRNQEMPSAIASYLGGNKHNNFDLNTSLMYKYTAEEPAAAKTSVTKFAGRMNGGDFKWTFSTADDEKYEVDQALKNALVAYKGAVKSVQGQGNMVVVDPSPVESSSSVKPASSSSVNPVSSSSVSSSSSVKTESSSSSVGGSAGVIKGDVVHNFTEDATSSDVFDFFGSLSTSKGVVTYEGVELSRCLKIETSTTIDFELAGAATMTLVFNEDFAKTIKVDGEKVTATAGVATVKLTAGKHTITKGDTGNLYLIIVNFDKTTPGSSSSEKDDSSSSAVKDESSSSNVEDGSSSSSEKGDDGDSKTDDKDAIVASGKAFAQVVRYNASTASLEIMASDVRRLDIVRMDGRKVSVNAVQLGSGMNVDLSALRPGVYFVRVIADGKMFQQKILKK
ncbi:MAG: T9SS type A sorting domain-containing protein [Fibrobacter sp.]|nr:T9SS type A sorting domain-containing protein [Fibrobacter sp.]